MALPVHSRLHRSAWAWLAIAASAVTYNLTARNDEMLSEEADRWVAAHPVAARLAITALAAHIANLIPTRFDPIHRIFGLTQRRRRAV